MDVASPDRSTARRAFDEVEFPLRLRGHPHIVPVMQVRCTSDHAFYSMPYIGESCREARLTFDEVRRVLFDVCSAVASVHASGILHRGVSRDNVLVGLDADGTKRGVLCNFKSATPLGGRHMTQGQTVYKPVYQALGGRVTLPSHKCVCVCVCVCLTKGQAMI